MLYQLIAAVISSSCKTFVLGVVFVLFVYSVVLVWSFLIKTLLLELDKK